MTQLLSPEARKKITEFLKANEMSEISQAEHGFYDTHENVPVADSTALELVLMKVFGLKNPDLASGLRKVFGE